MRLKGLFTFVLIYSNEIFISSNKNRHCFQQFNDIKKNRIFILLFGTFQVICGLFLLSITIDSLV